MSKKHFQALADALRASKVLPIAGWENVHTQWKIDVIAVADVCAAQNSRFDRSRFYSACGMEDAR